MQTNTNDNRLYCTDCKHESIKRILDIAEERGWGRGGGGVNVR